jgi:methionyl-tRNA formyltransferase
MCGPSIPSPAPGARWRAQTIKLWRARTLTAVGRAGDRAAGEPAAIIVVACGEGALRMTELQKAGGKRLSAANFLRGMPIAVGAHFDCTAR